MRKHVIVAVIAASGVAGCGTAPSGLPAAAEPAGWGVAREGLGVRLDAFLHAAADSGFSGVVLVAREGEVVLHKGYGWAVPEERLAHTAETVFEIASLSKQFTAAAVLELQEQGRLGVQDPIGVYLSAVPADKAGITLHHLLTHTAGLPRELTEDLEVLRRDELVERVLGAELEFAPGSRRSYSNAGYMLAAALVEIVSGQRYDQFLQDHLLDPAGLKWTAHTVPDSGVAVRLARPYGDPDYWEKRPMIESGSKRHRHGSGDILSNPGDLYRWHQALRNDMVLSEYSRRQLFTPHVPLSEGAASAYGYGWVISPSAHGSPMIWHNGGWYDFYAELVYYPEEGLLAIVTSNAYSDDFGPKYWEPLLELLFEPVLF